MVTMAGSLVVVVLFVYAGTLLIAAGHVGLGVTSGALGVLLAAGLKVALDRILIGKKSGRREEDTKALGDHLHRLPAGWWIFTDLLFSGVVVEFLVLGPGGMFVVEVFRWLSRDTGSRHYENVAQDIAQKAHDIEEALGRATGSGDQLQIQPIFFSPDKEGIAVGGVVLHPEAGSVRDLGGVLLVSGNDLLSVLRMGGRVPGVRTLPLASDTVDRLAHFIERQTEVSAERVGRKGAADR